MSQQKLTYCDCPLFRVLDMAHIGIRASVGCQVLNFPPVVSHEAASALGRRLNLLLEETVC